MSTFHMNLYHYCDHICKLKDGKTGADYTQSTPTNPAKEFCWGLTTTVRSVNYALSALHIDLHSFG